MDNDGMVMRSFCVDRDIDDAVLLHAKRLRGQNGATFRLFLETGLTSFKAGRKLPARVEGTQVLRMCYWDFSVAEKVRGLAFSEGIPESELISRVARLGMAKVGELTHPQSDRARSTRR